MIRLVLIDDHSLVLQGLENYFLKEDDFKIVGSYTEVADLLLCLKHEKVDVLVMDFMLKGVTAFDVISQINRFLNTVPKIVLLSGFYDTLLHKRAMDFGIQAFLPKESSYLDVKSAIYAVYKGNHVIPDGLLEKQENNTANQGINLVYPDKSPFPAILRRLALSDFQTALDKTIGQLKQNISQPQKSAKHQIKQHGIFVESIDQVQRL